MTPKEFEHTVASLLRLSGYEVKGETLLGHKKVDVYAEERRMGKTRRIAIECKLHAKVLSQNDVSSIYHNYQPLYESNLIDELLLVTANGVAPSAEAFLRESRVVSHLTLAQLQNSIVDFTSYLQWLIRQVDEDGLSAYYVRPLLAGGIDLQDRVQSWVRDGNKPLAILGSYGMGKTSFVRYFASELARKALNDVQARTPVVIKLAEISAEQSLEGLLGRIFATTGQVRNFTFDAFMELNSRGRFVIFLDGFDEMKHTLVWDQFRYNCRELNRLVVPSSRVVLLGRPTAFLSDAEHQYILHGVRRTSGSSVRDPAWPDYEEIELQPFSRAQVRDFLEGYALYLTDSGRIPSADATAILDRIDHLPADKISDLASRPVQLRILSEVLPQWAGDPQELTPTRLYSQFIN